MRVTSIKQILLIISVTLVTLPGFSQRTHGGVYTAAKLANYKKAVQTSGSLQAQSARVRAAVKPWMVLTDEQIWSMVPGQALPRCIDVTWDYDFPQAPRLGCLKCGDDVYKYGNYPYEPDFWEKPWKLTCPNCGVVFPTNDFGAYYQSGIDEKGLFNPAKADRKLLFNTEHPDPADPLHTYGVDDGFGFVHPADDGNGTMVDRQYKYIAYYTWKYWRHVIGGLTALSDAYIMTGDPAYAHKAAILLDRIADVYPAMDWAPYARMGWYHSDGSSRKGKIEGRIWETQTIQHLATAYDKIISGTVDDPALYRFLEGKARQFQLPGKKGSRADLVANIDKGILETAANAITSGRITGNEGMHQYSIACCALALNTEPQTSQWLDWMFAEKGGRLPATLMDRFDRDGMADEAAPGYCYLWPSKIVGLMEILEPYTAYTRHRISRDFPHFLNALRAPWRVEILNTFTPNIGDTGATGLIQTSAASTLMAAGFRFYHDAESARYAWESLGGTAGTLLMDYGSTNPATLNAALEKAALGFPTGQRQGEHMAGFGLASFQFGGGPAGTRRPGGTALWMYYGRNFNHGHQDRLNYSIYAHGTDLMPDLGYPEFANLVWKKRAAWNNNTISHNTVVVNGKPQVKSWVGFPRFYATAPGFGAVEVESRNAYPACSDYTRTLAFIQAPGSADAYAVDFFRVAGGNDHLFSLHGPPGAVTAQGLTLEKQTTGTYAGPHVAFGDNSTSHPLGYSYLQNVEGHAAPPADFTLDWKAQPGYRDLAADADLHLKLHVAGTPLTDVALADGVPPQNKPGNPKSIRYALLHRQAESPLQSNFVSVVEPYKDKAYIAKVTRLSPADPASSDVLAVKVSFTSGAADYIISNPNRRQVTVTGGPSTDGTFAWVRQQDGRVTSASLTRGTTLTFEKFTMSGSGNIAGKLLSFEKDPKQPTTARIQVTDGDGSGMVGGEIIFDNDRVRNACYQVERAEKETDEIWKITCGPGSFVRGFADRSDYSKGYVYNVADRQRFTVPLTTVYSADEQ